MVSNTWGVDKTTCNFICHYKTNKDMYPALKKTTEEEKSVLSVFVLVLLVSLKTSQDSNTQTYSHWETYSRHPARTTCCRSSFIWENCLNRSLQLLRFGLHSHAKLPPLPPFHNKVKQSALQR